MIDPLYITGQFIKSKHLDSVIRPEISLPTLVSQKLTGAILYNLPILYSSIDYFCLDHTVCF